MNVHVCRARTWRGGQCDAKARKGCEFCGKHQGKLTHGRYDNPMEDDDLRVRVRRAAICDSQQRPTYYSRVHMWEFAAECGGNEFCELSDEQYQDGLQYCHGHLIKTASSA